MDFLADVYPWTKSLHLMSIIAWMAAMLYLPRLFVYHAESQIGSEQSETFKVMERRLARAIMTPSMIAAWVFGLTLLATPGIVDWSSDFWMHAKLLAVIVMSGIHGFLIGRMKAFAADRNTYSARFYRVINEVPAVLMVAVVILVIVRPF